MELGHLLDRVLSGSDASFVLARHAENLQKDLVQYRVEASSAALNIHEIAEGVSELRRLGSPKDDHDIEDLEAARGRNPMLDCAMELYRPDEALALREAMRLYMKKSIAETFPEGLDYDVMTDDPHAKILRSKIPWEMKANVDTKQLERMAWSIASFGNEHTNGTRRMADGYSLTASCTRISGGGEDLHASFPLNDAGFFSIRFHVAVLEESFGNEDIRSGATFLELALSPEDMMTALRGHPTGADIPCSIDRIAGRSLARVTHDNAIEATIRDEGEDGDLRQARMQLKEMVAEARSILEGGARKAPERAYLSNLTSRILEMAEELNNAERVNISSRANHMNSQVRTMAREAISRIDEYVVEKHGVSLLEAISSEDGNLPEIGD